MPILVHFLNNTDGPVKITFPGLPKVIVVEAGKDLPGGVTTRVPVYCGPDADTSFKLHHINVSNGSDINWSFAVWDRLPSTPNVINTRDDQWGAPIAMEGDSKNYLPDEPIGMIIDQ